MRNNIQNSEENLIDTLLKAAPTCPRRNITESIFKEIDNIDESINNTDAYIDKLLSTQIEHNNITEKVLSKIEKSRYILLQKALSYTITATAACVAIFATTNISLESSVESKLEIDFEQICQVNEEINDIELLVMQEALFESYIK